MSPINVQYSEMVVAYNLSAMRDAVSVADVATGPRRSTAMMTPGPECQRRIIRTG